MATLSEQIYRELYRDITGQRLRCGQKLTLKLLKERFQVSHTPIREALMRLAENGLVTYYSNCGVAVTEFTESGIRQLYQYAAEMDALSIQFCEIPFNPAPLVLELQELLDRSDHVLAAGDLPSWKDYSGQFHEAFYRHAQNAYLDEAAARMRAQLELLACMYYNDGNIREIHDSHKAIFALVREGNFSAAAARMRQHLRYDMVYALQAYSQGAMAPPGK